MIVSLLHLKLLVMSLILGGMTKMESHVTFGPATMIAFTHANAVLTINASNLL